MPTPPENLWLGYGMTIDEWLASGKTARRQDAQHPGTTRAIRFAPGSRVLELGCAGGRMLRWMRDVADQGEVWGTDISGEHIYVVQAER